jgi:hypothetical protein
MEFSRMNAKPMTIQQACRLLKVRNGLALSKALGVTHQAVSHWRKHMDGVLPHPWPTVVRAKAADN